MNPSRRSGVEDGMLTILLRAMAVTALLGVNEAQAQDRPEPGPHPRVVESSSIAQNIAASPSSDDRWKNYVRDSYGSPGPYFATLMPTLGEHQRSQPPEYGEGWGGFGRRLWRRAAQYQLQTAIHHASAAALGTDTGYRRCTCAGGAKRLGYALSRTFVTRTRSGRTVPNVAYLGGVFGGGAIATETWYPDRYRATGEGVRAGALQVGVFTAVNVIQEFGPDLKRLFSR